MPTDASRIRLILELRRAGIVDATVLAAIESVPRERFIPETFQDQAWEDIALPIGLGQTISQPRVVAMMTEALCVTKRHRVLEIGTGSGYQAAVLAHLCRRLYTIERHPALLARAEEILKALGFTNIVTRAGDGMAGWPELAPFDRILVTAAPRTPPQALLDQLSPAGGIMVIPMGETADSQHLWRITRTGGAFAREKLAAVRFVPLLPGLADDSKGDDGSWGNGSRGGAPR
ncbi:protein-L-isoaspartate(D-aspartate) O-methyltransferase [Elioraea sp.]|uniref:protein-L-isoaspartate(D-aspartate) O-methyltransferase n=1 Tax=Elioraea sp. TaxID=2185103 RepID=UPI0025C56CDF|nr:protein-L-isoaspartate(D-aspartate) O-methyltransferase [Elioraea sp.]